MTLQQKIQQNLKNALKAKDAITLSVLRMLSSAIMNEAMAKRKKDKVLNDEEILQVIARQIKQRKDSIEQYKKGERHDLAKNEELEMKILEKYMPEQISQDEIRKTVQKIIDSGLSDFGPLMGKIMAELKGKADGAIVKKIVEQMINENLS